MKQHTISLGRIFGIPIGLDYSWFLIFGLITWTLAVNYFPSEFKNWPSAWYWMTGIVSAVLLFASVLLHEIGHSVIALHYKIPVRSITLFIFGGVAQIGAEPPSAMAEFWIALAGPVVSLCLAVFFGVLQPIFISLAPLLALAKYMAYINGSLGVFNLIPAFPLDGGRVFRAVIWGASHSLRSATIIAANVGRFIAFIFIFLGFLLMFAGDLGSGLWIAFIGWFLESAAASQVQQQTVRDFLAGHTVSQAMSHTLTTIPSKTSVQQLVDQFILASGRRIFMVEQDNNVIGLLTLHQVKEVPPADRLTTTVDQVMVPLEKMKTAQPGEELWAALEEMDRDGVNQLPVMSESHIEGMLNREDIVSFLRSLKALDLKSSV
jgi:Zn-dependent protease